MLATEKRKLAYRQAGAGFPLLFGHSFLWDADMWAPQVAYFRDSFRCITPEIWGHGLSPMLNKSQYTMEELAEDHNALLETINCETCAVIGLSVGGMWAAHLTLAHPEKVKALVLMDTSVDIEPTESRLQYFKMIDLIEQTGYFPEPMVEKILPLFFSPATMEEKPELVNSFKQHLLSMPEDRIQSVITLGRAIFSRESLMNRLNTIAIPTLIMVGENDQSRPVHESRAMAEAIPNAEFQVVPKAGHIPNLEHETFVNVMLENFLNKALAPKLTTN
jgi:pimeloyl-ACP methyl ester carboxylesterase